MRMKFYFKVKTKSGGIVGNILIEAKDQYEAENKLRQRYPDCQIVKWSKAIIFFIKILAARRNISEPLVKLSFTHIFFILRYVQKKRIQSKLP